MPKKVSLKHIVAEIERALEQLGGEAPAKGARSEDVERAKKELRAVRETVKAICGPNFDLPAE